MGEINKTNLTCLPLSGNLPGTCDAGSIPKRQCRLCITRGKENNERMVSIFSEEGKYLELAYKINKLLPTMVTPMDKLPQDVCHICVIELNTAFEFVQKCMTSEAKLRKMFKIQSEDNSVPIKVLQDYSAHWSPADDVENIGNSGEQQMQGSERFYIQAKEEETEDTEKSEQLKKSQLMHSDKQYRKITASNSLDSTNMNKMEIELPLSSMDTADDSGSVDNDLVSENNTTEAKELTVYISEKKSAETYTLDECRVEADIRHICKYCGRGFSWKADLFDHQTTVHSDLVIRCGYCLKVFYDKEEFEPHELAHVKLLPPGSKIKKHAQFHSHKKKISDYLIKTSIVVGNGLLPSGDSSKSVVESNSFNSDDKNESDKRCYYCNTTFTSVKMLRGHMTKEHRLRLPCRFCPITCSSNKELKKHEGRHRKKAIKFLTCKKCRNVFYYADDVRDHELTHMYKDGLICEICGEPFTNETSLEEHVKIHGGESSYLCETCGQNFASFFMFRIHKLSHIYPDFQKCEFCNSCFHSMADLESHLEGYHKKKKIHCSVCEKAFISLELLKVHKATHGNTEYKCNSCGKAFTTVKKLRNHAQIHSTEQNYLCEKCGKGFKLNSSLQNHRHFCQVTVPCGICSRKFDSQNRLSVHMRLHTGERPHLCGVCDKGFHAMWSLKQHMVSHRAPKTPCPICGILFTRKAYMMIHMKRHRVPCDMCGQVFENTPLLLVHQKEHVENGERPADHAPTKSFECDECGKLFVTALDLRKHRPIHSDERPHKCDICSKTYRRVKDLTKHVVTAHSGPKPFQCRFCTCTFVIYERLVKHENGHTDGKPYACQVCGLGFWSPLALEKHIIKHAAATSTGKVYSCKYCEKTFGQKSSLIIHRRTHSAHLTYSCSFCPRKFSHVRFMKRHKCALNPNQQGSSSSQKTSLPSLSAFIEESPTLVSDCGILQHVQSEIQVDGVSGGDNVCTESVDFLRHLKRLVKDYEADGASRTSSSGSERLDEEEMSKPVHPHLRHSNNSKNVKLMSDVPVYVRRQTFNVLSLSKMSSTALSRNLLEEVFTEDALLKCSVKGQRPNSTNKIKQRESLFSPGITAILAFVHKIDEFRGRPPIKNSDLVSAMGHRLNEIRKVHRLSRKGSLEALTEEATEGLRLL